MKTLFRSFSLSIAIAVFLFTSIDAQVSYELVAVSAHQDAGTAFLYDLDMTTGAASNGRDTGVQYITGIDCNPTDGGLYALTTFASAPFNSLLLMDEATGSSTSVGNVGFSFAEGDLAFDAAGNLWGINQTDGNTTSRGLVNIDATTGVGTLVANLTYTDWSGLAFDNSGSMFAITSDNIQTNPNTIFELDPNSGAVLSMTTLDITLGQTVGLTFDPLTNTAYLADGDMLGSNNLYTIDMATGVTTLIGSTGIADGVAGLAFKAIVPVPEPGGLVLLGAMGAIAFVRRRKN